MHLTPNYILYETTEEQLAVLMQERNKWVRANRQPAKGQARDPKQLSSDEFFAQTGSTVYVHKATPGNA